MSNDEKKIVSLSQARDKDKTTDKPETQQLIHCSFCERPNTQVIKMVKGPGVNICSECTMICVQFLILEDRMPSSDAQKILDAFWNGLKR